MYNFFFTFSLQRLLFHKVNSSLTNVGYFFLHNFQKEKNKEGTQPQMYVLDITREQFDISSRVPSAGELISSCWGRYLMYATINFVCGGR